MKRTLTISLLTLLCLTSFAQRAEVLSRMQIINDLSQVDVTYNNEFGKYRNNDLDDPFPYSVIKVDLEGDAPDIREAKERLSLDVGRMYTVEDICKKYDNCILFLVRKGIKNVYLLCGDGCERQLLYSDQGLRENKIYVCRVRYHKEETTPTTPSKPKLTSQYLVLTFEPKDAMVEIDGTIVETDEGIYTNLLSCGKHTYRISSNNYHTDEGTVTITEQKTPLNIKLRPAFGWIEIKGPNGASVYVDAKKIGTAPMKSAPIASGTHDLRIVKDKYLPHREQVLVNDNTVTTLNPTLIANFATIKLTTDNNAEIWVNDARKGNGSVTLDLEPGEYLFESRKESHRTQSISRKIDLSSSGTINIPAPIAIVGLLSVNVKPVGAKIYLDDKYIGDSPLLLNDILVGNHQVKCVSDGLSDEVRNIEIRERETSEIFLTMNKKITPTQHPDIVIDNGVLKHVPNFLKGLFVIGSDVKTIGYEAFIGCSGITSVTIPDCVTTIGNRAFCNCFGLTNVIIPYSVTTIGYCAFLGCNGLNNVTIPYNVTNVKWGAFASCRNLSSVTIQSFKTKFEDKDVFKDCPKLRTIYVPRGTKKYYQSMLPDELQNKVIEQ